MLAYSYVRFSSKRQSRGDSYRRQLEMTRKWCDRNNCTLSDENFQDLGVSGWTGENWREGGLSLFLDAVKKKRVKAGACLVVENLDRLSRDEIDRALTIFCDLLRAGITVVTLSPERVYTKAALANPTSLMEAILGFILANEESTKKSNRLREVWANKRKHGGSLGGLCPAWLRWDGRKYHIIQDKADVVKLIFRLSASGLGAYAIIRHLHAKRIGSIGRGGKWNHSYISILLHHRAVIGERVLNEVVNGKRKPAVATPGYYPPIIDRATFYKVQEALAVRDKAARFRGRGAKTARNLFTGLLVDARDGGSLVYYQQRKSSMNKIWKYVGSFNAMRHVPGSCLVTFPYEELELAILLALPSLSREDFFPGDEDDMDAVLVTKEGELAEAKANIEAIKKRILSGASATSLLSLLEDLDSKSVMLSEEVESLRGRAAKDEVEMLDELCDAITEMRKSKGQARLEIRQRLQGRMRVLIDKIYVLLSKSKSTSGKQGNPYDKHALVEIRFRSGAYWQMAISYIGGETLTAWEGQGASITSLPNDFEAADPLARLPVPDCNVGRAAPQKRRR